MTLIETDYDGVEEKKLYLLQCERGIFLKESFYSPVHKEVGWVVSGANVGRWQSPKDCQEIYEVQP